MKVDATTKRRTRSGPMDTQERIADLETPNVIVVGGRAFGRRWSAALADNHVEPRLLSSCRNLERHLALGHLRAGDLIIVESEILRTGGPDEIRALNLMRDEVGPLLVLIAKFVTVSNWQWLGPKDFILLPPPSSPTVGRLVARRLLELAGGRASESPRDLDHDVAILTGGVFVDLAARTLTMGGSVCLLTRGEAAVLRHLLSTAGSWRSTAEISLEVFQRRDPASRNLVWKYVSSLRAKLGPQKSLLRHSRTFGYQIATHDLASQPRAPHKPTESFEDTLGPSKGGSAPG